MQNNGSTAEVLHQGSYYAPVNERDLATHQVPSEVLVANAKWQLHKSSNLLYLQNANPMMPSTLELIYIKVSLSHLAKEFKTYSRRKYKLLTLSTAVELPLG